METYNVSGSDNRFTIIFKFASHAQMAYRILSYESRLTEEFTVNKPELCLTGYGVCRMIRIDCYGRCMDAEFESRDFSKAALERAIANLRRRQAKNKPTRRG